MKPIYSLFMPSSVLMSVFKPLFIFVFAVLISACDVQPPEYDGDLTNRSDQPESLPLDSGAENICDDDLAQFEEILWQPVLQQSCVDCHRAGNLASTTKLVFDPSSSRNSFARIFNYSQDSEQAQFLLDKPTGRTIHGGGQNYSDESASYQAMVSWLGLRESFGQCQGEVKNLWQGVNLLSSQQTLRKAAVLLAGRLPTAAEQTELTEQGDSRLESLIRSFMVGDNFTQFIEEGANSQLLTDKWNNDRTPALDLIYDGGRFPFVQTRLGPLQTAVDNAADDDARQEAQQAFGLAWQNTNFGLSQAPLKLISNIVNNERAYSEVLTANYLMVNPYTNDVYRTGLSFSDNDNRDEWQQGQITDGYLNGDIPHAGLLTDTMWLARYPSTDTNRNRARARWAYYFFLGVDIEATATRATDAAALMDTNNPTLNNTACTVCHIVMDPVAGAFQNFGDGGHYRDSWGGNESLPDSYKETNDYHQGDLWYRDMLSPGFNNKTMASSNNDASLRWLAYEMVADERFATGAVKFWWPSVYGNELLVVPTETSDADYEQKLAAYNSQQDLINRFADGFRLGMAGTAQNGVLNLKDLLVEMIISEPFRAQSLADTSEVSSEISSMGVGQLLTPEQLNRKLEALTGRHWQHIWNADNNQLLEDYYGLFGGIDSDSVSERATELNTLMSAVAGRISQEMPCRLVIDEFETSQDQRLLFKLVERSDTPESNNAAVRSQVNQLISHFWGNQVLTDLTVEQEQAYQLFNSVWQDRVANAPSPWLYHNDESAGPNAGDDDEFCQLDWDNEQALRMDEYHTVRSWMALLTYLLSDFALLYE